MSRARPHLLTARRRVTGSLRWIGAAGLLGLLCALSSCSEAPGRDTAADRTDVRPDVVLFVVDTLRADRLGPYGGDPRTSPRLARLVEEAVLFEDCRSPAPWTLPSMATLFTGLYPPSHGADLEGLERHLSADDQPRALARGVPVLGRIFSRAGYATWLRGTNPYLRFGLEKGFDDAVVRYQHAGRVVDAALERLAARDPARPLLLVLHLIDVHAPNRVGTTYGREDLAVFQEEGLPPLSGRHRDFRWLRKKDPADAGAFLAARYRFYDASIRFVDRQLGRLVDALDAGGRPYVLAYTADHGEDFRDHLEEDRASGYVDPRRDWKDVLGHGHGHNLHGTLTHVPLVVRAPGVTARRVAERVGLVDVLPTLCELAGVDPPPGLQGRSLVPLLRGAELPPVPYVAGSLAYGRSKEAWYDPSGEVLVRPESPLERPQLFDLRSDPGELRDLAADRPDEVERLSAELDRFLGGLPVVEGRPTGADPETLESLRALGYAGDDEGATDD